MSGFATWVKFTARVKQNLRSWGFHANRDAIKTDCYIASQRHVGSSGFVCCHSQNTISQLCTAPTILDCLKTKCGKLRFLCQPWWHTNFNFENLLLPRLSKSWAKLKLFYVAKEGITKHSGIKNSTSHNFLETCQDETQLPLSTRFWMLLEKAWQIIDYTFSSWQTKPQSPTSFLK